MSTTNFNTDWRITAAAIYRKPNDSKVFGTVELDVTELEQFIADKTPAWSQNHPHAHFPARHRPRIS
jgi:hypothetical protein